MSVLTAIFGVAIFGVLIVVFLPGIVDDISFESDCCSICESYWAYSELEDGEVVIDDCGGTCIATYELWDEYNNGFGEHRNQKHLDFLESMRVKNDCGGNSFDLINLSNPCPQPPNLKYIGTGIVYNYTPSSFGGSAYSIVKIRFNDSNISCNNCGALVGETVHVFKQKNAAWHWKFKEAKLFNASKYPDKPQMINDGWYQWEIDYQNYLDCGGVDVGDQFWM